MLKKIIILFFSGFVIGFGYFTFVLLAMVISDSVKEYKELDTIKRRGFIMVAEYDARKNRCISAGGHFYEQENGAYYQEICSFRNQEQ